MPAQIKIDDSCFNEEEVAKAFLKLDDTRFSTMKAKYNNSETSIYYNLLIKYLVSKDLDPSTIKNILLHHLSLFLYKLNENEHKELTENITLESLQLDNIETYDDNKYLKLYNVSSYEEYQNCVNEIASTLNNDKQKKKRFFSVVNQYYDYFKLENTFMDEHLNKFDLMISDALFNNNKLDKFSFEIIGDDYLSNWIQNEKKTKNIKLVKARLGHIINIIFKNDNLDFSKEMKTKSKAYYGIMINDKEYFSKGDFSFIEDKGDSFIEINKAKIKKEFEFKYNDINYRFTKEGIIRK